MIKIDIEGMEGEALDGAKATIARCRPVMFVEVLKSKDVPDRLAAMGYTVQICGMNAVGVSG